MKILRVFLDADMRNSHDGLAKMAKLKNIDTTKLAPGEFLIFVNPRVNKLKLFARQGVLAYIRVPLLNLEAIQLIPHVFNGGEINYDAALKKTLLTAIERRRKHKRATPVSPLNVVRAAKAQKVKSHKHA